jgi:chaperone required for assembly of F1-ATPase
MRDFLSDTPKVTFYSDPDPVKRAQKQMLKPLVKRFYKNVRVEKIENKFCILLDEKPLKTPRQLKVLLPNHNAAQLVACEFNAQETEINPAIMPITRLVNTALDGVINEMSAVRAEILRFCGNDLISYRADSPHALILRQTQGWDKYLTWLSDTHQISLITTTGMMHVEQDKAMLDRFDRLFEPFNDCFSLSCLNTMTSILGSAVLAVALVLEFVSLDQAWKDSNIDEDWTIEKWGCDEEAQKRRMNLWAELEAAYKLLRAVS